MKERSQPDPTKASALTESNREFISEEAELVNTANRIARRLLRNMGHRSETAADVAQEALFKYFQMTEEQRGEIVNKKAFLYRIMRNDFLNKVRKDDPYVVTSLDDLETEPVQLSETVSVKAIEMGLVLREIWNELEGEDRQLFRLLVLGFTGDELGAELGVSNDAARKRLSRLKVKLRRIVKKY